MGEHEENKGLRKELGLLGIFCIASGAMISSGLFILPGIAYSKAGPAVLIAYAIASLLVIPAMLSKAELATAMPKAGGTFFFIDRSMGPMMGTIGGFAAWFSLAFKSAFALVGIGVFAILLNPGFTVMQMKLVAVFFCIIFTIINIRGVKHSGKTQIVLVIGLLSLLIFYIVAGFFFIQPSHFSNFAPYGFGSIFSTAGLIFVSFGGLTKVCSVAEECKNPGRNIPLGMFFAWGIISLVYLLVIFVTIGVADPSHLNTSLTPISLGADSIPFLWGIGGMVMAIAAILAFITTANAGILAASRDPMAMGKDQLLPHSFAKLSKRGTPTFSILFTSGFMIFVILFLDLESLVKTASLLKILLFLFVIFSLIIMRESKIRHYRPKFRSPFYPWVQLAGIVGLVFLIIEMGLIPMILVGAFILFGFSWYWFFARDKIWREYSLLHLIERITGTKSTGYLVDEELREILIERDDVTEKRFEQLIKKCEVIDVFKYMRPDKFAWLIANKLADRLDTDKDKLYMLLKKREEDSNIVLHPGIAIFSHIIKGRDKFEIILVRSKKGIIVSDNIDPIHAFFVIVASPDQQSFYLHSLMWIVQIAEETDFEEEWIGAKNIGELRDIIISSWKKRKPV
ncbi:amino acid transporter [Thermoplasmatales archaeon SCGC AB-540-F20]|nr:amino acid transporter [Thermoplasmatales archaeon SCGC AB-540-F20]